VWQVRATEWHRLGVGGNLKVLTGHLHSRANRRRLPVALRGDIRAGQPEQATWPGQARGVRPVGVVRVVGHGEKRGDIHLIAQRAPAPLREPGMRPGKGPEHGIIEWMRHRHRPGFAINRSTNPIYAENLLWRPDSRHSLARMSGLILDAGADWKTALLVSVPA